MPRTPVWDAELNRSEGSGAPAGYLGSVDCAPRAAEHLLWRWRYDLDDSIAWLDELAAPFATLTV